MKQRISKNVDRAGNLLLSPPFGGFGQYVNHGPRNLPKIALTFDDGPSDPSTPALLDALGELGVKATFFCVGVNTALNPHLVERAYKEGHVVGNHSIRHSRKAGIKFNEVEHIDRAAQAISEVTGCQPRLYRPPWGWLTPWEAQRLHKRGYTIVGWDVYTLDWKIPEPDGVQVAEKARLDTKPGSILLFHDAFPLEKNWDKKETIRAIKHLVPALQSDGYEFVTVDKLLNVPAYGPAQFNLNSQAS